MGSETPKYRLVYFDVRALGEPIRWIFQYTKTPFVDERVEWNYPKWFTGLKEKVTTFKSAGQMPILYEEGEPELSQSHVISRYLARKFDLHGRDAREDARIDEIISMVYDLFIWWRMWLIFERDPERKKENRARLDPRVQQYYQKWNDILEKSGGPYLFGNRLTHADFWVASFISIYDDPMAGDKPVMPPGYDMPTQDDIYVDLTKNFPALRAHKERVHAIPEIKAWVEKRHQTIA